MLHWVLSRADIRAYVLHFEPLHAHLRELTASHWHCLRLLPPRAAGAAAFSPASVVPRAANGVTGLCMSAGGGKPKVVAAFRGAPPGKAGLPPQGSDPSSINLVSPAPMPA